MTSSDLLDDIRSLFDAGHHDDALDLLNDILGGDGASSEAVRLKFELCLLSGKELDFVGECLRQPEQLALEPEQIQAFYAFVDEVVREELANGRSELREGKKDWEQSFERAIQMSPGDGGVALAAALALLEVQHLDERLIRSARFSLEDLKPHIERFLLLALEYSAQGDVTYQRAADRLLDHWLQERKLREALDWLEAHGSDGLNDVAARIGERAALTLLERAASLLHLSQVEMAVRLVEALAEAVQGCASLHLLQGEIWMLRSKPRRALAAFRKALRAETLTVLSLTPLQDALKGSDAMFRTCDACGKSTSAAGAACDFCGTEVNEQPGLRQRLDLLKAPDAVVAHAAIADLLLADARQDEARKHLTAALSLLSKPHAELEALLARTVSEPAVTDSEQPRDLLLEAIEAAHQDVTPVLLALIRQTCEQEPERWRAFPLRKRVRLGRALLKAGELESVQQMLHAAFPEPRKVQSVIKLAHEVDTAIQKRVEALTAEAAAALQSGHSETALALADRALYLQADSSFIRLLRGRARLNLGYELAALEDFRVAMGHPGTGVDARLAAAGILERREELAAALALLDGVEGTAADVLRARLHRRSSGEPAVLLRSTERMVMHDTLTRVETSPHVEGFFAVVVRAVGRPWHDNNWTERVLTAGYDLVQTLGGLRNVVGDPVFALRFIAQPHPHIPERGRLTAAMLVRVSAEDAAACHTLALDLWHTLHDLLPLAQDHVYLFEPVVDEDELASLLTPFEPTSIAEIVRREEVPQGNGDHYAIYPFTVGALDLHSLCWSLLRQKRPSLISIHLLPTELMAWERATLDREMMQRREPDAVEEPDHIRFVDPISQWWRGAPRWEQAQANRSLVDSLRAQAYVLRVMVAGSAGSNPLLPERIAATLFGPVRQSQGTLYGGYEIARAGSTAEIEAAKRNLSAVDVESWVYTAAPDNAIRLRHLVSEVEAAAAFRLPIPGHNGLPGMRLLEAKPVPPPAGMPERGILYGESVARFAGTPMPITQSREDRRRHAYIVGKTGVGKSTLLLNLALQDIEAGQGVCVVDPHGELIDDILMRIPASRRDDVVLFDPADDERPIGLNLLEWRTETEKHQIVNEFIGMLMRMYDPQQTGIVGPRFQHNVRNAMLTVMTVKGSTLIEVVRALSDSKYVQSILPNVTDPVVRTYWEKQIANTSDFHKSEVLDYIVSKFNKFVGELRVRNIIGQGQTTLDFRGIMDRQQILLVKLSKGIIGPENAQFLGLLLVQRLLLTALSRADMPASRRSNFYLYMDEFQNFATEMFGTILSEGRKYGVATTVANQYLTQLDMKMRDAIFGNVGTIISFRVGTQDAMALAPEMYPVFSADDLLNLPRYTACVKLLVDGLAERPFTMRTLLDLRAPDEEQAAAIRHNSRQKYGRAAAEVNQEIMARFAPEKAPPRADFKSLFNL